MKNANRIFNQLPRDTQNEVKEVLTAFDSVNIDFYNGKYHVHTGASISSEYAADFKVMGIINNYDVYTKEEMEINYKNL